MTYRTLALALALAPLLAPGLGTPEPRPAKTGPASGIFARALLQPKSGSKASGTVEFFKTKKGIRVKAVVAGTTPGKHGIHIHEKGDCSSADAASAGAHFNPTGEAHGGPGVRPHHMGDLGNVFVEKDGRGELDLNLSADAAGFGGWDQLTGKSVVLHEREDDLQSDPAGNSGGRIACGVIQRAQETSIP